MNGLPYTLRLGRLGLPLAVALVGGALALPRPVHHQHVQRPSRPAIIAAIRQGHPYEVTGRIIQIDQRDLVLRVLMGTKQVAFLRHTQYINAAGVPLRTERLQRGDLVHVTGYPTGNTLLAITLQDMSRH